MTAPRFERGDRVVVEPLGGEFFEGRVLSVSSERLRIERERTSDQSEVTPNDVYRLPAAAAPAEVGRFAICELETKWVGCRVDAVVGAELEVTTLEDRSVSIPRAKTIAPSSVTELNLKQRFERRAARVRFIDEALRAGEPLPVAHFRPAPNTRVVARRDGQWWSAVVSSFDEDEATVRFSSDGIERELEMHLVVPEPVNLAALPPRGAFVLVRPRSPSEPWRRLRVQSAAETNVKLVDPDGAEQTVELRDVLALAPVEGEANSAPAVSSP